MPIYISLTSTSQEDPPPPLPVQPAPPRDAKGNTWGPPTAATCKHWQIEKILNVRKDRKTGALQFLVQWVLFSPCENTWENEDDFKHAAKDKIEMYKSSVKGERALAILEEAEKEELDHT